MSQSDGDMVRFEAFAREPRKLRIALSNIVTQVE